MGVDVLVVGVLLGVARLARWDWMWNDGRLTLSVPVLGTSLAFYW